MMDRDRELHEMVDECRALMSDYIKREDAKELFYMLLEHYHDTGVEVIKHTAAIAPKEFHVSEADDIADFNSEINGWKNGFSAIPSADVAPVRHGHWIEMSYDEYKCSVCEKVVREEILYAIKPSDREDASMHVANYCPNCGAKMDEEENE